MSTAPLNTFPLPADPEAWSAQTVEEEAWFPVTCAHEPGPCSTLVQRADAAAGGEGGAILRSGSYGTHSL